MQGYFNKLNANTTTEYVNAAVNFFREKRGDGVENPDQIKFIRDFLVSTDTIGANNSLQFDAKLQPSLYLGSLILYNVPAGIGGVNSLSLVVKLKYRNEWNTVYNSAWSYYPLPRYNSFQSVIVFDVGS
jgi:singapore isolate B (sub-type 7) whole genome shotgun sequence assembly, scaffold_3